MTITFHQNYVPTNELSQPGECRKLNLLGGELGHVKGLAENLEFHSIMKIKIKLNNQIRCLGKSQYLDAKVESTLETSLILLKCSSV